MDQRDEHQYIVQPYQMSPYTTSSAGPLARQAGPTHKVARLWKLWQWGTIEVKHLFKGRSIGWWWTETPKQKNKLWLLGPTSYTDLYQLSVVMNWPPPNMSHLQSWGSIRTMSQSTPNPKFQNTTAWFFSANRVCQASPRPRPWACPSQLSKVHHQQHRQIYRQSSKYGGLKSRFLQHNVCFHWWKLSPKQCLFQKLMKCPNVRFFSLEKSLFKELLGFSLKRKDLFYNMKTFL